MALKIYETPNPTLDFSENGTFTNPLSMSFNGVTGEVIEQRFYLRNDDVSKWYSNITIQAVDHGDAIVDGTDGYSWKLIAGDERPLEEQWGLVTAGDPIDMEDIGSASAGDDTTYLPFWLRIEVPRGAPVESFQGVQLDVQATESLV